MKGKPKDQRQRDLFNPMLIDFTDMEHELVLLAKETDWQYFEKEYNTLYSDKGRDDYPSDGWLSDLKAALQPW